MKQRLFDTSAVSDPSFRLVTKIHRRKSPAIDARAALPMRHARSAAFRSAFESGGKLDPRLSLSLSLSLYLSLSLCLSFDKQETKKRKKSRAFNPSAFTPLTLVAANRNERIREFAYRCC